MLSITKANVDVPEVNPFARITVVCVAIVGSLWAVGALITAGVGIALLVLGQYSLVVAALLWATSRIGERRRVGGVTWILLTVLLAAGVLNGLLLLALPLIPALVTATRVVRRWQTLS